MSEKLDDDLKDLLDQLDEQDEFLLTEEEISEAEEPEKLATKKSKKTKKKPAKEEELDPVINKVITGDERPPLRPDDEVAAINDQRRFDGSEVIDRTRSKIVDEAAADVSRYLDKMEEVSNEVLQACRSDRQEAQDVINMLRGQCDTAHNKSLTPSRMYIDGLVKAVEVKANINTNAVKVMEGVAKMIAATKAGISIQNNSVTVSGAELDDILSGSGPDESELD